MMQADSTWWFRYTSQTEAGTVGTVLRRFIYTWCINLLTIRHPHTLKQ